MSRENLELVVRASRAVSEQPPDFETINSLHHPEHVFVTIPASKLGEADGGGARGVQGVARGRPAGRIEFEGAVDIGPDLVFR